MQLGNPPCAIAPPRFRPTLMILLAGILIRKTQLLTPKAITWALRPAPMCPLKLVQERMMHYRLGKLSRLLWNVLIGLTLLLLMVLTTLLALLLTKGLLVLRVGTLPALLIMDSWLLGSLATRALLTRIELLGREIARILLCMTALLGILAAIALLTAMSLLGLEMILALAAIIMLLLVRLMLIRLIIAALLGSLMVLNVLALEMLDSDALLLFGLGLVGYRRGGARTDQLLSPLSVE